MDFFGCFGRDRNTPLPDFNSSTYNPFRDGSLNVGLSQRKGYKMYDLVGMWYYLTDNNYGRFNGYAIAEKDNPHDEFAIAIYEENGHKIGHLPMGSHKRLYKYIEKEGGKVHAYGYVQCGFDGHFYGAVCVESNKNEVTKRNAPYKIQNEEDRMRF